MNEPTLRERQRKVREEAILDTAYALLAEQRYAAMSMDELATRVGISKATLYQHFPSKEELVLHVVLRMLRQGEERMLAIDPTLPAIRRLELMLRQGLMRRANLWGAQMQEIPISIQQDPRYREQMARLMARVHGLIDQAKQDGDIPAQLSTAVIGFTLSQLFRTDYAELLTQAAISPEQLADSLIGLLFEGLRARR